MKIKFKNYCNLETTEKFFVLKLRNSYSIRKYMYNSNVIKIRNHLSWIDLLKNRNDCIYYAIFINDELFGGINLKKIDNINHQAEMGIYVKRNSFGAGLITSYFGIEYFYEKYKLKKLMATILSSNKTAYKMNVDLFGYTICENKSITVGNKYFLGLSLSLNEWKARREKLYLQIKRICDLDSVIWN